jgi:VIT1/CCC1 family predicted Fe2+/Mn2+ transporter
VSSQADTEGADLARERHELATDRPSELRELTAIYQSRGLDPDLAGQVAAQLMAHDALAAHARDELGITEELRARPLQAALASAATFSVGAALPLLMVVVAPDGGISVAVAVASLLCLAGLGALAARTGGAPMTRSMVRVMFWGALAMALTALVGKLVGTAV